MFMLKFDLDSCLKSVIQAIFVASSVSEKSDSESFERKEALYAVSYMFYR